MASCTALHRWDRHSLIPSVWIGRFNLIPRAISLFRAAQFPPAHLDLDCCSYIAFRTPYPPQFGAPPLGQLSSVPIGAPLSRLALLYLIPHSIPLSVLPQLGSWSIPTGVPLSGLSLLYGILHFLPPLSAPLHWYGLSSIPVGATQPRFCAPVFLVSHLNISYCL